MYPNRLVRLATEAVKAAGFEPTLIEGKAYRVAWFDGDRRRHTVPVSRSPSGSSQERFVLARVNSALRASVKVGV